MDLKLVPVTADNRRNDTFLTIDSSKKYPLDVQERVCILPGDSV